MLVTLSFMFYALCLFDTLGDVVGLWSALWVLIVVPLLPALLYAVVTFSERRYSPQAIDAGKAEPHEASEGAAGEGIELGTIATISPVHSVTTEKIAASSFPVCAV
jgi:hypothetical protein